MVDDPGLLDEVAGLVEWPVPLLGRIDDAYMDLPPEVRQVSMRVNQRYFAFPQRRWFGGAVFRLRRPISIRRTAAPSRSPATSACCAPASPMRGTSGTSTARHGWSHACRCWTTSHSTPSWAARASACAGWSAWPRRSPRWSVPARRWPATRRRLAKADLVTGMVGEFPELQGVMGRYYALHDGEDRLVADAIRDHYAPKGPTDAVPTAGRLDRRRAGRQAGSAGRLLRHRRATDRRRRSVCPAPRRAGHHPHHPRERPAA